jgi:hydrogenase nickel incorporation protein HypA/HybF
MHELAAVRGATQTALEWMRAAGAARVTRVHLVLGASGHSSEDAVRQHFALCARDTPAAEAQLDITWEPVNYQCFECLSRFTSLEPPEIVRCPQCDGLALEVAHSDACYVAAIEVVDEAKPDTVGAGERTGQLATQEKGGESCA